MRLRRGQDGVARGLTVDCTDTLTTDEYQAVDAKLNLRLANARATYAHTALLAALPAARHDNVALLDGAIAGNKHDRLSQGVMFILK